MGIHDQSGRSPQVLELGDPGPYIVCAPEVYRPSDDSFLLVKGLKTLLDELWPGREMRKELSVLEIGTGTGVVGISLLKMGIKDLVMTDISPRALSCSRENLRRNRVRAKLVRCSLFDGLRHRFDLVVFNPPYLPREKKEPDDLLTTALCGGLHGHETIQSFLTGLPRYLADEGRAVLIVSSLNPGEELQKDSDFRWRLLGQERFFFERIYCYALARNQDKASHDIK